MENTLLVLIGYNRLNSFRGLLKKSNEFFFGDQAVIIDFHSQSTTTKMVEELEIYSNVKHKIIRETNYGCRNNILDGLSKLSKLDYDYFIILEDDLDFNKSLFEFFTRTQSLIKNNIVNIGAFNFKYSKTKPNKLFKTSRFTSWGWSTNKLYLEEFINWIEGGSKTKSINNPALMLKSGSDIPKMWRDQINGKINSWAISYVVWMFINNYKALLPQYSYVINTGFNNVATHTKFEWPRQPREISAYNGKFIVLGEFSFQNYKWLNSYSPFVRAYRKIKSI